MGKRGPKKQPSKVRLFNGNPSHRPIEPEPEPPVSKSAQPPEWLGDKGAALWRELAPSMEAVGVLTVLDLGALSQYCHAWDQFYFALGEIERDGYTCVGAEGGRYQHPAVSIKKQAIDQIARWSQRFGLDPASRVGLKVDTVVRGVDELEEFKRSG